MPEKSTYKPTKKSTIPFESIQRWSEADLARATKPHPFRRCPSCGNSIISSATFCSECLRLREMQMAPAVKQLQPSNDTQKGQSYPAFNHKGYQDRVPTGKFPASQKERM